MLLTPSILTLFILNTLFLIFLLFPLYLSIKVALNWNGQSSSKQQYKLEKQSYLATTIVKFVLFIKIPLFLFFIYTLDELSNLITGAMCAAGVVDATEYGFYLLLLKLLNIYLFGAWLITNRKDYNDPERKLTKFKFQLFIPIFALFILEYISEFLMFNAIDVKKIVSCCGSIYSASDRGGVASLFAIDPKIVLTIFYVNFIALCITFLKRRSAVFSLLNILFVGTSIVAIITFFSPYIYELPTHHCPFCILQKDYYYVGYLLYALLFLGSFLGISSGIFKNEKLTKLSFLFTALFTLILTLYPVSYYLRNGVWLN